METNSKPANGPLLDLLDFLYMTGCRPQEARTIEARHINDDLVKMNREIAARNVSQVELSIRKG